MSGVSDVQSNRHMTTCSHTTVARWARVHDERLAAEHHWCRREGRADVDHQDVLACDAHGVAQNAPTCRGWHLVEAVHDRRDVAAIVIAPRLSVTLDESRGPLAEIEKPPEPGHREHRQTDVDASGVGVGGRNQAVDAGARVHALVWHVIDDPGGDGRHNAVDPSAQTAVAKVVNARIAPVWRSLFGTWAHLLDLVLALMLMHQEIGHSVLKGCLSDPANQAPERLFTSRWRAKVRVVRGRGRGVDRTRCNSWRHVHRLARHKESSHEQRVQRRHGDRSLKARVPSVHG
eukprot:scaffold33165_cov144-Isochrysis_galbana.AAC.4